jgi:hypothetical protein
MYVISRYKNVNIYECPELCGTVVTSWGTLSDMLARFNSYPGVL